MKPKTISETLNLASMFFEEYKTFKRNILYSIAIGATLITISIFVGAGVSTSKAEIQNTISLSNQERYLMTELSDLKKYKFKGAGSRLFNVDDFVPWLQMKKTMARGKGISLEYKLQKNNKEFKNGIFTNNVTFTMGSKSNIPWSDLKEFLKSMYFDKHRLEVTSVDIRGNNRGIFSAEITFNSWVKVSGGGV